MTLQCQQCWLAHTGTIRATTITVLYLVYVKVVALLNRPLERCRLSPSPIPQAHVHFVGVNPAHRGVGLASAMYKHFFDKMQIRGCDIVHAVTSPSNTASVAFHEGLGFEALRVAGTTDSRSGGPIDNTMDGCLDASFDGIMEGTLGESAVDGAIDGTIQGAKGPRGNPHNKFESVLESGSDGTSRVLDEFVHVDWDGPDGGDRVLLQINI